MCSHIKPWLMGELTRCFSVLPEQILLVSCSELPSRDVTASLEVCVTCIICSAVAYHVQSMAFLCARLRRLISLTRSLVTYELASACLACNNGPPCSIQTGTWTQTRDSAFALQLNFARLRSIQKASCAVCRWQDAQALAQTAQTEAQLVKVLARAQTFFADGFCRPQRCVCSRL